MGPTLLRWLESEAFDVHEAILRGDAESARRLGHGNAVAQPYHHVILPLSSEREKRREIHWGIRDFERRFGRRPAGMWLPETAVDLPTLRALAEAGIAFTILAPHQVDRPPPDGTAGRVSLGGGREIAVFVYDGELSHGVAFGALLRDPRAWRERLTARDPGRPITSIATDGETFGHHHPGAERTLMDVIARVRRVADVRIENFASCLARTGAAEEIDIVEPSSWSCSHGVERWRDECGCMMAPETPSQQEWRRPLRDALDWLAGELDELEAAGAPWTAADDGLGPEDRGLDPEDRSLARDRAAMLTSCAWFFDDIGGLEPIQALSYAAHAIDLVAATDRDRAARLEAGLIERLAEAPSNDPGIGDGARLYRDRIRSAHPFGREP